MAPFALSPFWRNGTLTWLHSSAPRGGSSVLVFLQFFGLPAEFALSMFTATGADVIRPSPSQSVWPLSGTHFDVPTPLVNTNRFAGSLPSTGRLRERGLVQDGRGSALEPRRP